MNPTRDVGEIFLSSGKMFSSLGDLIARLDVDKECSASESNSKRKQYWLIKQALQEFNDKIDEVSEVITNRIRFQETDGITIRFEDEDESDKSPDDYLKPQVVEEEAIYPNIL